MRFSSSQTLQNAALAALVAALNAIAEIDLELVVQPFTPMQGIDYTTLTLASFPGYTHAGATTPNNVKQIRNQANGNTEFWITPPVGANVFKATGTATPSQTVFGFAVIAPASTSALCTGLCVPNAIINSSVDGLGFGAPILNFLPGFMV